MKKKILVVDDQADIRRLVRMVMGNRYEIMEAEEGVTALSLVRGHHPDLVVLDVMMPGEMDGYQVLEAIKNDPLLNDIRVIMLTACGQKQDYEMGKNFGADDYFIKPFSPFRLACAVDGLIG